MIRYDAHPMAILTSSFAAIGSYYSEVRLLSLREDLKYNILGRQIPHCKVCVIMNVCLRYASCTDYQGRTCSPRLIQPPLLIWTSRFIGEFKFPGHLRRSLTREHNVDLSGRPPHSLRM